MKFRKASPPQPTLEERLQAATFQTEGALSIFEQAAQQLDVAAEEASVVKHQAELEVMRLQEVRDSAFRQQTHAAAKAETIRELLA